ncbi:HlyD family type I secretion periplasmic adaptor subunit [Ideonella sp. 4Y16]|uniref:HlyD family type I secretion periplasmic adaptor subunit n=1 Tax=Ideonella alba TaxID=2824118 RepID=UPI001B393502|nr:HlyD family type I secretion periplasmic adaptor subunit [Ideonella alba]MBQ0943039.1 HlyD family type I secretion periplasmic adaptor subunit [Ideonella alba]
MTAAVAPRPADPVPGLRPLQRQALWIIGAWLALMTAWLTLAPIAGGVVAQGVVKVDANRRTVTHRDGGTVARIAVSEGQLVRRGELLVELEDVRVDASQDQLRAAFAADRLRQSRLQAEVAQAAQWQPPAALLRELADVKRLPELAAQERAAFAARRANLVAQIDGQSQQIRDTRTEIEVRERERVNSQRALALMTEELRANQALEAQNFVGRARVLGLERNASEYQSRHLANEAELAQARQRLGALDARSRSLRDSYVQTASDELRELGPRLAETEQRLRASSDDQSRQRVLAPVDGRLLNLRVNTPGSALGPREPVVDIVPADAPLFVEARLPLDAGADVREGMAAELKLLTGAQRFERLLAARVQRVSADALTDERNGSAYFTVLLQVDADEARRAALPLRPGMAAEVYIRVTERSALDFLLEPVAGFFRQGFRER